MIRCAASATAATMTFTLSSVKRERGPETDNAPASFLSAPNTGLAMPAQSGSRSP